MIVVTHRGPFTFHAVAGEFEARRGAGGVVGALGPLLAGPPGEGGERGDADEGAATAVAARGGGAERPVWLAAAIGEGDRGALAAGATDLAGVDLRLLDLDPRLHTLHYDLVSNGTLWFLLHGLFDLPRRPRFDRRWHEAWDAYVAVNDAFADAVVEAAAPRDTVLVHDYQLALVPGRVRALRPDLRVAHFTHTPFCGPGSIGVLPFEAGRALLTSLAAVPHGFHSARWAEAFRASCAAVLGDVHPSTFVAPLGPDLDALEQAAGSAEAAEARAALDELVGDRLLLMRTDRIEPSKNIVRGFLAYETLLEDHPEWCERVVFVAMCYPSREQLPEYLAYRAEVEAAVERVNERFATPGWRPVVLDTRDDYARTVAGLGRADVLLVNPVKDGLNLVAKEGPLLSRRDTVLCLSPGAGAFDELGDGALAVHPFDLSQTAAQLHAALSMPADERAARAGRLRAAAQARTAAGWLADLVAAARGTPGTG